jgi:hypothetical protein
VSGVFSEWQPKYAARGIATFPIGEAKKPSIRGWQKVVRIVLALDAADLHKHRRLEVEAALVVMLDAIAVFARSELRKRPFPRIQAIALLLHLDLIGARLVRDLEQLLEQAISALFSRARVQVDHCCEPSLVLRCDVPGVERVSSRPPNT